MVIQGHDSKYDMMTLIYVCTTANMDKRTLHKANMDGPTQRDTTYEDYLMTIGRNLTHWKMRCWIWLVFILHMTSNTFIDIPQQQDLCLTMF